MLSDLILKCRYSFPKKLPFHRPTVPNRISPAIHQVAELGDNFSGGERQRLGLARCFLADAPVIFLDEPTSNLDSQNESLILKTLYQARKDKTIVTVSHRDSTLAISDRVYKLT